jgi:hypothetical protein
MKITGAEANKLLHIARFPQSKHSRDLAEALDGDAKEVATAIVSGDAGGSDDVRDVVAKLTVGR